MNALSSLQFLAPWFFLAGLLIPLLVLAYLRRKPRAHKEVPTLLLLSKLTQKRLVRRRFHPPLNFFIELLALIALLLAATFPVVTQDSGRTGIVLDNSLSMGAQVDGATASSGELLTRLELAKKSIREWIAKQPATQRYTLYSTSPHHEAKSAELVTAEEVYSALDRVELNLATDNMVSSVERLAEASLYDSILVVSDRTISMPEEAPLPNSHTIIQTLELGNLIAEKGSNPYLTAVRVEDSNDDATNGTVVAEVALSGNSSLQTKVSLWPASPAVQAKPITSLETKAVNLTPGVINLVRFSKSSLGSDKSFRVTVDEKVGQLNLLKYDDQAWLVREKQTQNRLLIVSPEDQNPSHFGLSSLRGFEIEQISPSLYAQLSPEKLRQYSAMVFRYSAPIEDPPIPTLLVLPPSQNSLAPVSQEVKNAVITSWSEDHPLTSYLKVPLMKPIGALTFTPTTWAQNVINIEQGAVLVAGEHKGRRIAAIGFEIFPFDPDRSPAHSVLTLNLLRWLGGKTNLTENYLVGSSLSLSAGKTWVIANPQGTVETRHLAANEIQDYLLAQPGIYQLTSISGNSEGEISREKLSFPVNILFPEESDLYRFEPIYLPRAIAHTQRNTENQTPIWPTIIKIAIGLLILEFLVRTFSSLSRRGLSTT